MEQENRFVNFIKGNKDRIVASFLLGLLPLLLCILYCWSQGGSFDKVFLPSSYWNDELFYYKQVEGILQGGVPAGYFGFNESTARFLTFGVWSPVLFLPWVLWGLIFGWNLLSPVICNLVLIMVTLALFAWIVRPNLRQTLWIGALYSCFTIMTRYVMSCSPEIFCCCLVILFGACLIRYEQDGRNGYDIGMLVLIAVLTLMRPYYLVLMILPALGIGKPKAKRLVQCALAGGLGLGGFGLLRIFLSAPYLIQNVGLRSISAQTVEAAEALLRVLKDGLKHGNQCGTLYGLFGLISLLYVVLAVRQYRKAKCFGVEAVIFLVNIIMMFAIVYMYTIHNGDRHLMAFLMLELLLLACRKDVFSGTAEQMACRKKRPYDMTNLRICDRNRVLDLTGRILMLGALVFYFIFRAGNGYDRAVPFENPQLKAEIDELSAQLAAGMPVSGKRGWENTCIWLAYDLVEGEVKQEMWQQLYALPAGIGVNYCTQTYVLEHFDRLKPRFLAAVPGGDIEKLLREKGAKCIVSNDEIAVYDRSTME